MPTTANSAELMSPSAPTGVTRGGSPGGSGELVDARHRLGHHGVGRPVAVGRRPDVAEARHRDPDQRGVPLGQRVVAEAQPVHRARLEVLADDVEPPGQLDEQLAPARVLEVDADRALVEVVAEERRADRPAVRVGHGRLCGPSRLAVAGVLDLHDLGAEAGQQLRGVGEGLHLHGGQDPHAVERLAVPRRVGVGDVSEAHRAASVRTSSWPAEI
jgi:hypothetical protein